MTPHADQPARRLDPTNPHIEHALHYVVAIGAALVVLLPGARGFSETLGWLPMWLLAMPLTAWWALHRFRLPASRQHRSAIVPARRRRPGTQARRRAVPVARRASAVRAA